MVRDVDQIEEILLNKTGRPVSHSRINLTDFLPSKEKREPLLVDLPPQVSIYQEPLLYLMFHKTTHRQLFDASLERSATKDMLKGLAPFVNPLYLPVEEETDSKPKGKFSALDDRLFLLGLIHYSSKYANG